MSYAMWVPLFVTALVPNQVINHVFEEAVRAKQIDYDFINRWVLIRHPDQQTFERPTNPPVDQFESGFLGSTIEQIQDFVATKCGPDGLGTGPDICNSDSLANDAFVVIDERTARDNTVLFYTTEEVDQIEEAEVRVAWNKSTERDDILTKFVDPWSYIDRRLLDEMYQYRDSNNATAYQACKERIDAWEVAEKRRLAKEWYQLEGNTEEKELDHDKAVERLDEWTFRKQRVERGEKRWFEFRIGAAHAISCSFGIQHVGPHEVLTSRSDLDFDENGVMLGL